MVLSQQQHKLVLRFKSLVLGWEGLRGSFETLVNEVRTIEQDYFEASLHSKDGTLLSCIIGKEKSFCGKFDAITTGYLDLDKKARFLAAEVEKPGILQLPRLLICT